MYTYSARLELRKRPNNRLFHRFVRLDRSLETDHNAGEGGEEEEEAGAEKEEEEEEEEEEEHERKTATFRSPSLRRAANMVKAIERLKARGIGDGGGDARDARGGGGGGGGGGSTRGIRTNGSAMSRNGGNSSSFVRSQHRR